MMKKILIAALLAGSAGALVVTPHAVTVGASGAVFGLMGAAFLEMRHRARPGETRGTVPQRHTADGAASAESRTGKGEKVR